MTRVMFEAPNKKVLKPYIDLAKQQGISVKYIRVQPKKTNKSDSIIDQLYGSWKDDRTADEIIKDIYSSRMSDNTRKLEEW